MFATFTTLLESQRTQGKALGAFTCYDIETAIAVIQAAQEEQSGVIFLISEKSFASVYGHYLVRALHAIAEVAPVPICLQLDHVSDLKQIEDAFHLGVGAVMADGSKFSYEENIAFTRAAVEIARRHNGGVEAELGRIEGNEDIAQAVQAGAFTDPAQAAEFIERTGIDCLAVSIGNVHGVYTHPPLLDWPRLQTIHRTIPTALSLHGASGLSDELLIQSIKQGISKINVNTELRSRYFEVLGEKLPTLLSGSRLLDLQKAVISTLKTVVTAKLHTYELLPHSEIL